MSTPHQVVIIGGGFGGLYAARSLRKAPVKVTLIDRRNFHLFQPLLYQVATAALSPANIAAPLRYVLKNQENARVLLAEVTDIDVTRRLVKLKDGQEVPYDTLIVAPGSHSNYFGHPEWIQHAPGLKSVEDAMEVRRKILMAFETAEREKDLEARRSLLTFVVIGAGPTGVELAGSLGEIARDTLRHEFRSIQTQSAKILLIDAVDRVLPTYPEDLSARAVTSLTRLGVEFQGKTFVTQIDADGVVVKRHGQEERILARTVLWAAGVQASPLGEALAKSAGVERLKGGRLAVGADLTLPGRPEVFVIGDLAQAGGENGKPLPGIAPVAMQQGRYAAQLIEARLRNRSIGPFRYHHKGDMATIGRAAAVADLGWIRFNGPLAWLTWLVVHLWFIVEFEDRLLVFLQWAWNYITRNRGARLITGEQAAREPVLR
jgi:NADH:ubiquinone reductase (H+-translocating)